MGNRLDDAFWRTLQQIRDSDVDSALAKANSAVDVGEGVEFDAKIRHRSARTQLPIRALKQQLKIFAQDVFKLTRPIFGTLWQMGMAGNEAGTKVSVLLRKADGFVIFSE